MTWEIVIVILIVAIWTAVVQVTHAWKEVQFARLVPDALAEQMKGSK